MTRILIVDEHSVVISACRQLFGASGLQIAAFGMNVNSATKRAAIDAGATAFLSKDASINLLLEAFEFKPQKYVT
jgi:hypothetical protein